MTTEQEPGIEGDAALGVPGPAEPMPSDELTRSEPTLINGDDE